MATLLKHYGEQVPKKPLAADKDAYPLASKQLNGEVADHLQGGGSPKSVIRDHPPSVNSSYYYSCSSSSSAERASFVNSQRQSDPPPAVHLVDRHVARYNKLKLMAPQHHHYKVTYLRHGCISILHKPYLVFV